MATLPERKNGWLSKLGAINSLVWKNRYFSLRGEEDNAWLYFLDKPNGKLIGVWNLSGTQADIVAVQGDDGHRLKLTMKCEPEPRFLRNLDDQGKEDYDALSAWLDAIQDINGELGAQRREEAAREAEREERRRREVERLAELDAFARRVIPAEVGGTVSTVDSEWTVDSQGFTFRCTSGHWEGLRGFYNQRLGEGEEDRRLGLGIQLADAANGSVPWFGALYSHPSGDFLETVFSMRWARKMITRFRMAEEPSFFFRINGIVPQHVAIWVASLSRLREACNSVISESLTEGPIQEWKEAMFRQLENRRQWSKRCPTCSQITATWYMCRDARCLAVFCSKCHGNCPSCGHSGSHTPSDPDDLPEPNHIHLPPHDPPAWAIKYFS